MYAGVITSKVITPAYTDSPQSSHSHPGSGVINDKVQEQLAEVQPGAPANEKVRTNKERLFNIVFADTSGFVPKYAGLSGTALCFAMNPNTGYMVLIRVLLDSGANLTMLNRSTKKAIGLTGQNVSINLNAAGGGKIT